MRLNHSNAGFTLIEMLIALVILSIGFLGVAGLQVVSLRNGQDSIARSTASIFAYSIIEVMHANPKDAEEFKTDWQSTIPECDSTKSSIAEEINCFYNRVMNDLPGGNAQILHDPVEDELTIEITWLDKASSDPNAGSETIVQQKWVVKP